MTTVAAELSVVSPYHEDGETLVDNLDFDMDLEFFSSFHQYLVDFKTDAFNDSKCCPSLFSSISNPRQEEICFETEGARYNFALLIPPSNPGFSEISDVDEPLTFSSSSSSSIDAERSDGACCLKNCEGGKLSDSQSTMLNHEGTEALQERMQDAMMNLIECMKRTDSSRRKLLQIADASFPVEVASNDLYSKPLKRRKIQRKTTKRSGKEEAT